MRMDAGAPPIRKRQSPAKEIEETAFYFIRVLVP